MTEGTLRQPHERRYHNSAGQLSTYITDNHGTVMISEELLHSLLTQLGWTEDE